MKKIEKSMDILCKAEEWVEIGLLIILSIDTALGVIFRYFLNKPLIWTEELARFVFIWMIAVGVGYCITKHKHIKIEMFVNMMPAKLHKIIDIIMSFLPLITFIYLIPSAYKFMIKQGRIRSTALLLPFSYVYAAVFVGSILIVIHLLYELYLLLFVKEGSVV